MKGKIINIPECIEKIQHSPSYDALPLLDELAEFLNRTEDPDTWERERILCKALIGLGQSEKWCKDCAEHYDKRYGTKCKYYLDNYNYMPSLYML